MKNLLALLILSMCIGCTSNDKVSTSYETANQADYILGECLTRDGIHRCMVLSNSPLPEEWTAMMVYSPELDINIYTWARRRDG